MNRNLTLNVNRLAAVVAAATLTVSSSLAAERRPAAPVQGTVVYVNGQAMLMTPVPQGTQFAPAPAQGYPQAAHPVQYATYPQQPQMVAMPYIQPQPAPPPESSPYGSFPRYVGEGASVAGSQVRRISLPTGSPVFVRLISALSSNRLVPGAPFEASLDAPLEVGGLIIADRGARVEGRITESNAAGKISGQSGLALQLTRIMTADGKTLDLMTNTIAMAGGTSYGRDVAKVAGLAGVGAALGAINSGRGAAIGSAFGAAAGVGWVLNSRGKATVVASEQRLEFHLIAPVTFTTW